MTAAGACAPGPAHGWLPAERSALHGQALRCIGRHCSSAGYEERHSLLLAASPCHLYAHHTAPHHMPADHAPPCRHTTCLLTMPRCLLTLPPPPPRRRPRACR